MSTWTAKRFWKDTTVEPVEGGYTVRLDGRAVKTPAKAELVVPAKALADRIAAEWDAQEGEVKPAEMPYTRSTNAAIDKVAHQHAEVAELIAAYGDADLTCYRADSPAELVARQAEAWDPLLGWIGMQYQVSLTPFTGVVHHPQDPQALAILSAQVHKLDAFALTAFHDLVGMSGSLVIGFAALHDLHPANVLWQLSRVDETFQEELWGADEEASEVAVKKEKDFLHAKAFYDISRQT